MSENLSVSWNEYEKNICRGLNALQQHGEFVDMTIAADGHHVKVHQIVLSLVSPFIKELISAVNCPHPVIFLNKVSFTTMQAILEYAYTGEVIVRKDIMGEFLEACKDLHIRGLENMLKNAQSTVSNMFNDATNYHPQDDCNEPEQSKGRKRKKSYEETQKGEPLEEGDQYDSDDFLDDLHKEQVQTSLLHDYEKGTVTLEEAPEKNRPTLQYSVSCQGNLQILLNRYLYGLRHTRKNEERFWRCIYQQRTGCPAIVTTLRDNVKQRSFPHNHPFHDVQILKRTKNGNIFTSVREGELAAAEKKRQRADIWYVSGTG